MPSFSGFDFVDSSHLSLFSHSAPLTSRSEYFSVSDRAGVERCLLGRVLTNFCEPQAGKVCRCLLTSVLMNNVLRLLLLANASIDSINLIVELCTAICEERPHVVTSMLVRHRQASLSPPSVVFLFRKHGETMLPSPPLSSILDPGLSKMIRDFLHLGPSGVKQ